MSNRPHSISLEERKSGIPMIGNGSFRQIAHRAAPLLGMVLLAAVASGCALRKGPPDPAKVQQKISAAKEAERALVERTVTDADRAARLAELLAERDRIVDAHGDAVAAYRERMRALNADYDTTDEELAEAVTEYNVQRFGLQTELAELIAEMKATTTAAEWKAIAKYELKKLDPRQLVYGPAGGGA